MSSAVQAGLCVKVGHQRRSGEAGGAELEINTAADEPQAAACPAHHTAPGSRRPPLQDAAESDLKENHEGETGLEALV